MDEINLFNSENLSNFDLSSISRSEKETLLGHCTRILEDCGDQESITNCLVAIRILTRDKANINLLAQKSVIKLLLKHTKILEYAGQHSENCVSIVSCDARVVTEGLKCLCNLMYNCVPAVPIVCSFECIRGMVNRIKTYDDPDLDYFIKFYDMRILFLITALSTEPRAEMIQDHGAVELLNDALKSILAMPVEEQPLLTADIDLICEVLKLLFNVSLALKDDSSLDSSLLHNYLELVFTLRQLLIARCEDETKRWELISNTVNLLSSVPSRSYKNLVFYDENICAGDEDGTDCHTNELAMIAIQAILDFLSYQLSLTDTNRRESLAPVLQMLSSAASVNRSIRKFCRVKVLPYLGKEVEELPEVGTSLRNRLCRLLTHPVQNITESVSYFIFILCKESVSRTVKYTGYGNFAGYLARHGLMTAGRGEDASQYSSSSSDSETEEYADRKEKVNPVTGRAEEAKADPMEGMSDERKEYEAMKLVQEIDRLQRSGIIQPGVIGEDGNVRPVEHVLELSEKVSTQQEAIRNAGGHNSESDVD